MEVTQMTMLRQINLKSDSLVELRQGIDGVRYIHLSEYLQITLVLITVCCLCIILPINLSGNRESTVFGRCCITNLDSSSPLLWAHFVLAPSYLLLILVMVWMYTWELGSVKLEEAERVTIIRNADVSWNEEHYWNYFDAVTLKESVVDIQLGYDVSELYDLIRQREEVLRLHTRYKDLQSEQQSEGDRSFNTGPCGCCGDKVDGLEYFTTQLVQCDEVLRLERDTVRNKRCNFVFVVWSTPGHCKMFINTHKPANICKVMQEQRMYSSYTWQVRLAPIHYDIMWDNMSTPKWFWWTRATVINFILLLFVIFFTTPLIILKFLTNALQIRLYVSSFYYVYITILLLILLTNILPEIVNWTCKLEKHRTKSGYFHWMLRKAWVYLLISLEILPLVGYTSIATFFEELFSDDKNGLKFMFSCMFEVYNSAFFCNLIIASALVGRSIELLQIKGIYTYIWERSFAKTKREYKHIFKNIKRDFNIGYNYAKLQAYLCLAISFSLFCPVITVFGMAFLIFKYLVDKYLMLYCTGPCGSYNSSTHYTSAYFTIFSGVLLQIYMFIYAILHFGTSDGKTILSGIVLLLIIVFLATKLGELVYNALFPSSPHDRDFLTRPPPDLLKDTYMPAVINCDTRKQRKRAKRVYNEHTRAYSMSSLSALLDSGITANYKSIASRVGSISGRSIKSYVSNQDSNPGPSSSVSNHVTENHVTAETITATEDQTLDSTEAHSNEHGNGSDEENRTTSQSSVQKIKTETSDCVLSDITD